MNAVNVPLLRKAVEWVEVEAQRPPAIRQWYQGSWLTSRNWSRHRRDQIRERFNLSEQEAQACGTAYCVAGYVAQICDDRYARRETVDKMHVMQFAQQQLGLTDRQASALFNGENDAPRIRVLAELFAGEPL